jgi:hypothetical protein
MRPGKQRRSAMRLLLAAVVAVGAIVALILVGDQTALADAWWGSGQL